jgi:hypothetical protein
MKHFAALSTRFNVSIHIAVLMLLFSLRKFVWRLRIEMVKSNQERAKNQNLINFVLFIEIITKKVDEIQLAE